jgi:preprotein translocase subunit YajC
METFFSLIALIYIFWFLRRSRSANKQKRSRIKGVAYGDDSSIDIARFRKKHL